MRSLTWIGIGGAMVLAWLAGGCVPTVDLSKQLDEGFGALQQKNYPAALSAADGVLSQKPPTTTAATAHYLKGRAIEERAKPDDATVSADLQLAREQYVRALELKPPQPLEANLRAQVANVAYFQDDYATAISQWGTAYADLPDAESQAWALYRIGVSQQRQGLWDSADRTYARVIEKHPGSVPAQRAKDRTGARAFYVQIGAFKEVTGAERTMNDVRLLGVAPVKSIDPRGLHVVRAGPFTAYTTAKATRQRLIGKFSDATIVP